MAQCTDDINRLVGPFAPPIAICTTFAPSFGRSSQGIGRDSIVMKQQSLSALAVLALLAGLAACGGGGGGGSSPIPAGGGGATPTPVASPVTTPGSQTTNASGVVVNDANGSPLAGVPVKLMPWGPCGAVPPAAQITPENDGCPTPLPSPQATTNQHHEERKRSYWTKTPCKIEVFRPVRPQRSDGNVTFLVTFFA